jgi:transcriptional antiterminator Rof (Rho-off)
MDQRSRDNLERADRESEVVRLRFDDGSVVEARIRDVDWHGHRTITYLDMDSACCAFTADLDRIAQVSTVAPAGGAAGASDE